MVTISIRDAKNRLTELARKVEQGETITVTRNGKPVMELAPLKKKGGIRWEAIAELKKELGVKKLVTWVSPDFDDPLPEDFLLKPLPARKLRRK